MSDPREVIGKLRRAHQMSVSGPGVAPDATLYGQGAETLTKVLKERDEAREELRDKSQDDRLNSERRSWSTLVPEDVLYPDNFVRVGAAHESGFHGRKAGNRIYHRNHDGLLQPLPGEVWKHVESGRTFLVLACAEYRYHAVTDVEEYVGPMPEALTFADRVERGEA